MALQLTTLSTTTLPPSSTFSTSTLPSTTSPTTITPTPVLPAMPSTSDDAPGGTSDPDDPPPNPTSTSVFNYYFIFLALLVCLAGLTIFFILRRRRRLRTLHRNNRQTALARDLRSWDPRQPRRRYWAGRWRHVSRESVLGGVAGEREEGLNEHGEAPPPYVPKRSDSVTGSNETEGDGEAAQGGVAVPLQVLTREQAGLKPPDYVDARVEPIREEEERDREEREEAEDSTQRRAT